MTNKLQAILACASVVFCVAVSIASGDTWALAAAFFAFMGLVEMGWRMDLQKELLEWIRLHRYMEGRIAELKEWGVQDGEEWKHGGRN